MFILDNYLKKIEVSFFLLNLHSIYFLYQCTIKKSDKYIYYGTLLQLRAIGMHFIIFIIGIYLL